MKGLLRAATWITLAVGSSLLAQSGTTNAASSSSTVAPAQEQVPDAPAPAAKPTNMKVVDWKFSAVTGALFGATIANAETLNGCDNCTFLPASIHRRGFTYGVGLPVDIAVSYVGYSLKKHGQRWWYVPSMALTVANAYLAYHWKESTDPASLGTQSLRTEIYQQKQFSSFIEVR